MTIDHLTKLSIAKTAIREFLDGQSSDEVPHYKTLADMYWSLREIIESETDGKLYAVVEKPGGGSILIIPNDDLDGYEEKGFERVGAGGCFENAFLLSRP